MPPVYSVHSSSSNVPSCDTYTIASVMILDPVVLLDARIHITGFHLNACILGSLRVRNVGNLLCIMTQLKLSDKFHPTNFAVGAPLFLRSTLTPPTLDISGPSAALTLRVEEDPALTAHLDTTAWAKK